MRLLDPIKLPSHHPADSCSANALTELSCDFYVVYRNNGNIGPSIDRCAGQYHRERNGMDRMPLMWGRSRFAPSLINPDVGAASPEQPRSGEVRCGINFSSLRFPECTSAGMQGCREWCGFDRHQTAELRLRATLTGLFFIGGMSKDFSGVEASARVRGIVYEIGCVGILIWYVWMFINFVILRK